MSELSKSNNPRVRRSYAHVMIGKLARGEVNADDAHAAVRRAEQTRKGRASNFGRALLRAQETAAETRLNEARQAHDEALRTRPTADCDVEIIAAVPLPGGDVVPVVIGAGSHEDFDRAYAEGEKIAAGPGGRQQATAHVLRSLAETGGVETGLALYRGAELGRMTERARQLREDTPG